MSLNSVDIIKSTLIQKVENDCRKIFKTEWDKINNTLEHNKLEIDDMFYTYLNYCLPKTSRRTLHKELIPYFTDKSNFENIFDTINEIKEFNKAYIEIIKDSNDKHIYALEYLPTKKHWVYWTSILATSKFKNYEWHEELKKCLVSYYYKNWIGGGTISRVAQTSYNIIQKIKGKKDISEIKEEIEKSMERFDMEKLYSDNLGEKDVYHTNWIRPLLCMLEYRYKDDSNQNLIPLNQDLQIEHVLPKNPKQGEWQKINNTKREELTHCLGNLTLLSQRKNGQGSNDEYHKKIDTYMEKDGVATSFDITRQIPRDYPTEWTADTITERQESLINDINNMLEI